MKGGLLDRLKKSIQSKTEGAPVVVDDGIDLDSGTIVIEEGESTLDAVGTYDVFREGEGDEGRVAAMAVNPHVYIVDLRPFMRVIGTTTGSRMANSLLEFSENLLRRSIGRDGIFYNEDDEVLYFRFNEAEKDGLGHAIKIVNEIGTHFLRDAFHPEEFIEEVLEVVDAPNALDDNGVLDPKNIPRGKLVVDKEPEPEPEKEWEYMGRSEPEDIDPMQKAVEVHHRSDRVNRGPERRQQKMRIAGPDRRASKHGRRVEDQPGTSVWKS